MSDDELEAIKRKKMMEMMNKAIEVDIPNEVIHIQGVDHFNELVNKYKDNLIIVDMWAEWCGPCIAFGPIFEATQKEYHDKGVIFCKLNVDHHQAIAQQFQVFSIPTTLFIKNKKIVYRQIGLLPANGFKGIINKLLEKYGNE